MTEAILSKTQFKTLINVQILALISEDGWVSEYDARTKGGAWVASLSALVRKGLLVTEVRPFVMPAGSYVGQTLPVKFYSVAKTKGPIIAKTESTVDSCGKELGDHCPRCGDCECPITTGVLHLNSDCPGRRERHRILYPFSRG